MAFSKANQFEPLVFQQSFWAKAQSHPARIIILKHLQEKGTTRYSDICRLIPLARTTVSQHLRMLRQFGLIEVQEKYPNTYYQLRYDVCKDLAKKIRNLNSCFDSEN